MRKIVSGFDLKRRGYRRSHEITYVGIHSALAAIVRTSSIFES